MNDDTTSQIRSIQALSSVAIIASPVSLVFGGVLLSLVALICALIGRSKLNGLASLDSADSATLSLLTRQNKVGIIVSIAALVINVIFFALAFSALLQAMQSGDYSQLYQLIGMDPNAAQNAAAPESEPAGSIWD